MTLAVLFARRKFFADADRVKLEIKINYAFLLFLLYLIMKSASLLFKFFARHAHDIPARA